MMDGQTLYFILGISVVSHKHHLLKRMEIIVDVLLSENDKFSQSCSVTQE